jgi:serine/threonine protein kinase
VLTFCFGHTGVCLYIMLAGCLPFDERSVSALLKKIAVADYEMPPWISQNAAALLRAILTPNPAKRCPGNMHTPASIVSPASFTTNSHLNRSSLVCWRTYRPECVMQHHDGALLPPLQGHARSGATACVGHSRRPTHAATADAA